MHTHTLLRRRGSARRGFEGGTTLGLRELNRKRLKHKEKGFTGLTHR